MWHEARKHERKLRGMMVDYKKRAERRREYYEKIVSGPDFIPSLGTAAALRRPWMGPDLGHAWGVWEPSGCFVAWFWGGRGMDEGAAALAAACLPLETPLGMSLGGHPKSTQEKLPPFQVPFFPKAQGSDSSFSLRVPLPLFPKTPVVSFSPGFGAPAPPFF